MSKDGDCNRNRDNEDTREKNARIAAKDKEAYREALEKQKGYTGLLDPMDKKADDFNKALHEMSAQDRCNAVKVGMAGIGVATTVYGAFKSEPTKVFGGLKTIHDSNKIDCSGKDTHKGGGDCEIF